MEPESSPPQPAGTRSHRYIVLTKWVKRSPNLDLDFDLLSAASLCIFTLKVHMLHVVLASITIHFPLTVLVPHHLEPGHGHGGVASERHGEGWARGAVGWWRRVSTECPDHRSLCVRPIEELERDEEEVEGIVRSHNIAQYMLERITGTMQCVLPQHKDSLFHLS